MNTISLQIHTEGSSPNNWYWTSFTAYNKKFYAEVSYVSVMHPYLDLDVGFTHCVIHPYQFDMIDRDNVVFEETGHPISPVWLAACVQEFSNQPCLFEIIEK